MGVQIFKTLLSILRDIDPKLDFLNPAVILFLSFWEQNTVFHSSCAILRSYQEYVKILISAYPRHHSIFYFVIDSS